MVKSNNKTKVARWSLKVLGDSGSNFLELGGAQVLCEMLWAAKEIKDTAQKYLLAPPKWIKASFAEERGLRTLEENLSQIFRKCLFSGQLAYTYWKLNEEVKKWDLSQEDWNEIDAQYVATDASRSQMIHYVAFVLWKIL